MLGLAGRSQHIMDRLFVWFTCIHLLCLVIAAKIVLTEPGLWEPNKLLTQCTFFWGGVVDVILLLNVPGPLIASIFYRLT